MKSNRVFIIVLILICIVAAVIIINENHQKQNVLLKSDGSSEKEETVNSKEDIEEEQGNIDLEQNGITKSTEISDNTNESEQIDSTSQAQKEVTEAVSLINPEGSTLYTRISTPDGYKRVEASKDSLLYFMRNQELKPDGSPVLLFDSSEKGNQSAQVAVFSFDVGESDLQQCADSIIRVYSEYYWSIGAYDKIRFHLTNGFLMDYLSWREGKRIQVKGNTVSWIISGSSDYSYECFRAYLKQVMIYAGTLSLSEESTVINKKDLKQGDVIINGGSPGHCVLIVDVAENKEGKKCYLLAQGFMPAQDFHILKNPVDPLNPWYYEADLEYPIQTPQYTFEEGSIRRWMDGFN